MLCFISKVCNNLAKSPEYHLWNGVPSHIEHPENAQKPNFSKAPQVREGPGYKAPRFIQPDAAPPPQTAVQPRTQTSTGCPSTATQTSKITEINKWKICKPTIQSEINQPSEIYTCSPKCPQEIHSSRSAEQIPSETIHERDARHACRHGENGETISPLTLHPYFGFFTDSSDCEYLIDYDTFSHNLIKSSNFEICHKLFCDQSRGSTHVCPLKPDNLQNTKSQQNFTNSSEQFAQTCVNYFLDSNNNYSNSNTFLSVSTSDNSKFNDISVDESLCITCLKQYINDEFIDLNKLSILFQDKLALNCFAFVCNLIHMIMISMWC